jgi:hypothetical protein
MLLLESNNITELNIHNHFHQGLSRLRRQGG